MIVFRLIKILFAKCAITVVRIVLNMDHNHVYRVINKVVITGVFNLSKTNVFVILVGLKMS